MTVAEVLERAADLIEPDGAWTQRIWGNVYTCMCAEGAIHGAVGVNPLSDQAVADRAVDYFARLLPWVNGNPIAHWNDDPSRTQAEVVAKLREAASLAREQEA